MKNIIAKISEKVQHTLMKQFKIQTEKKSPSTKKLDFNSRSFIHNAKFSFRKNMKSQVIFGFALITVCLSMLPIYAETVRLAVGRQLPPYVIDQKSPEFISRDLPASNTYEGMELEIVREALNVKNHKLEPFFLPLANVEEELKSNNASGVFPCDETIGIKGLFFSDSHITYQNVAISLKKDNLKIDSISDLNGKKIAAFQNAKIYLGEEFRKIVENNPDYKEFSARGQHLMSLFYDKTADVIIMDVNIFNYYVATISNFVKESVQIHPIFPKNEFKVGFFDEKLRDDFNTGLQRIKQSKKNDAIFAKYKSLMETIASSRESVKIAFGTQLAPYVITDLDYFITKLPPFVIPDDGAGMELEIVRAALKVRGKILVPVYLPLINVKKEMDANGVAGVAPCREEINIPDLYFSDSHISYHNKAITLKKKKFKINLIEDLAGKKIAAFQNAKVYLGPEFAEVIEKAAEYKEIPLRGSHSLSLFNELVDVIIMDENIFKYRMPIFLQVMTLKDIVLHDIFEPNYFKVGFLDEKLRNEFNEGLKQIKKDGTYEKIIANYNALIQSRLDAMLKNKK